MAHLPRAAPLVAAPVTIPLEDRCYLCPECGGICHGVEHAARHAEAEHPDATELTLLDLDDPKHLPDDPLPQRR